MVARAYNPSTWEAEAGGSSDEAIQQVLSQPTAHVY